MQCGLAGPSETSFGKAEKAKGKHTAGSCGQLVSVSACFLLPVFSSSSEVIPASPGVLWSPQGMVQVAAPKRALSWFLL